MHVILLNSFHSTLIKFIKKHIPLKPIVSATGAPTRALDRFLVDKLQSFIEKNLSFIKNPSYFIQKLDIFT
jgi:hypothetical protein